MVAEMHEVETVRAPLPGIGGVNLVASETRAEAPPTASTAVLGDLATHEDLPTLAPEPVGPCLAVAVAELTRAVEAVRDAVRGRVEAVPPPRDEGSNAAAALAVLDGVVSVLGVQRAKLLSVVKLEREWEKDGAPSDFVSWRQRTSRQGRGTARAEDELATTLTQLTDVSDGVENGSLTLNHAKAASDVLTRASQETREVLISQGEEIAKLGRDLPVPVFKKRLAAAAASLEADKGDLAFHHARAARYLRLTPRSGGVGVEGFLDPVAGNTLRIALEALTQTPATDDDRTPDQRRADALLGMADRALSVGVDKAGAQIRPHLAILVREDTWLLLTQRRQQRLSCQSGGGEDAGSGEARGDGEDRVRNAPLAELLDGTLIPYAALDVLACDGFFQRIVLDADGSPLNIGRSKRAFEGGLRRAILARDRHCQWPGCTMRATWCEIHHLQHWAKKGVTSLANGITLCSHHHHETHNRSIQILPTRTGYRFLTPHGRHLGTTTRLTDELLIPRRGGWNPQGGSPSPAGGGSPEPGAGPPSAGSPPDATGGGGLPGTTGRGSLPGTNGSPSTGSGPPEADGSLPCSGGSPEVSGGPPGRADDPPPPTPTSTPTPSVTTPPATPPTATTAPREIATTEAFDGFDELGILEDPGTPDPSDNDPSPHLQW